MSLSVRPEDWFEKQELYEKKQCTLLLLMLMWGIPLKLLLESTFKQYDNNCKVKQSHSLTSKGEEALGETV